MLAGAYPTSTSPSAAVSTNDVGPHTNARGRLLGRPGNVTQHSDVEATGVPGPARRLRASQRVDDLDARILGQALELILVDHVLPGTRRVEKPCRHVAPGRRTVAEHRHQGDDARAAPDQQKRAARRGLPDEVPADRTADLESVAGPKLVSKVRRHLAVVEALDRDCERLPRRRGDRVASLRLVAVLGGQAHVEVLAGPVSRPGGGVEDDGDHARGLSNGVRDLGDLPRQSPQYRCSCHGSP